MAIASLLYSVILYPILYIFPAYVANGLPVVFGGTWIFKRVGKPIDGGKTFRGRPIFGINKTWRGLAGGLLCGFATAVVEGHFIPILLAVGILTSVGTHVGDLLGSFIKRQSGVKSGESTFLLDAYMFLLFAFLFVLPIQSLPNIYGIAFIIILTGVLHRATNVGAFHLKIKKVPW